MSVGLGFVVTHCTHSVMTRKQACNHSDGWQSLFIFKCVLWIIDMALMASLPHM